MTVLRRFDSVLAPTKAKVVLSLANEAAGDHFTPQEAIELMVNLLFIHDDARERLEERRSALIAAAVTGQIDVGSSA